MLKTVIYTLREKENLSQEKLAEILGVSRQAVQKWETGVSVPELSKIIEISKYFGISLDTMLLGRTRRIVVDELKYKDIKPLYKIFMIGSFTLPASWTNINNLQMKD